jgi:hypothetical protein
MREVRHRGRVNEAEDRERILDSPGRRVLRWTDCSRVDHLERSASRDGAGVIIGSHSPGLPAAPSVFPGQVALCTYWCERGSYFVLAVTNLSLDEEGDEDR